MARRFLLGWTLLVLLGSASALPASILWSDPGAVLVHDSGPGHDILNSALKRDDSSRDTLYFRFHVSPLSDASTEEYYAAFELFEGDAERLGVGNALEAYAYSAFFKTREAEGPTPATHYVDLRSSSVEPSGPAAISSYELPRRGQERTIVFKVQYVPNGDDLVTVWLNPDLSAGATEVRQSEALTTRFSADAAFDELRLRHGGRGDGWVFTDLAIATSFADFADPGRAMSPAIDPSRFFELQPLSFDIWLRDAGMPRVPIRALAQTADGYLWLAGDNQLSRFDGVRFVPLNLPPSITNDAITALCADSHGALWVGTRNRGLARYLGSQFDLHTTQQGLPSDTIVSLAAGNEGTIWVGTDKGAVSGDQKGFQRIKGLDPLDQCTIRTLVQDQAGVLWLVAAGKGVFQFSAGALSQVTDPRVDELLRDAQSLLPEPNGRLWVGAGDDFVLCRDGTEWRRYRTPRQSTSSSVRALAVTPDGTVWAGSPNEGLFRFKQGKLAALNSHGASPETQVSALFVDREGDLWVGGGSGLRLLKRQGCFVLGQAEGLGHGPVSGLAEVSPGVIWVAQPGHGLYRWEGDTFRRLLAAGLSSADASIGPMLVTSNRACWLASTNGLLLFRDPQAAADEGLLFELPHANITALAEAPDGSIWAGTRQGKLWHLQQGQWQVQEKFASSFPVTSLLTEPDGNVWVGTEGGGLYLVGDSIRAHFDRRTGLGGDAVRALHRDAAGTLWIGTDPGGLAVLSNQVCTVVSTSAGLPGKTVQGILEDPSGRLWLNDGAGLTCIAKPQPAGPAHEPLAVYPLNQRQDDEPAPRPVAVPALPTLRDSIAGRLWFGSLEGVVVAEPEGVATHRAAAPLLLEEVLVDGLPARSSRPLASIPGLLPNNAPAISALHIGPGRHRLDFRYTAPQFHAPDLLRFRYRLEGLDPDWVEAGSARVAQYAYVPPGDYRFIVELRRPGGAREQAAIGLSLAPRFWQRPWVIGAALLGLLALSGGSVRFAENRRMKVRLNRLEQQKLLESERIRIAQDLHDEMGAKLCRISFLSEHANRLAPGTGQLKEQVATIASDSRELLLSLDEIVWAVNPRNDTLEHVASYIGQYAQEYFQFTGIECALDVPSALPHQAVSSQTRHQLFLAVHEALTNVLKHSGATLLRVVVSYDRQQLRIQVEDNGRGFVVPPSPSPSTSPGSDGSGNGLRNMHQRIAAIGGRCAVTSTPGHGTIIQFVLNLSFHTHQAHP